MATMICNYSFRSKRYTLRFRGKKIHSAPNRGQIDAFMEGWNSERAKRGEQAQSVRNTWTGNKIKRDTDD